MCIIDDLRNEFQQLTEASKGIQGEIDKLKEKVTPMHVRLQEIALILNCVDEYAKGVAESYATLRLEISTGGGDQYEAAFKTFEASSGLSNPLEEGLQEDNPEVTAIAATS